MDEDEILEEEESLAGESPNYVKFEDIARTEKFQAADVDRQLEIIDNLYNHNRDQVGWGMSMVDELNRLEGESQLQKRLLIARDSSKNGEDWSKDLYKQQYDAYARFYDSERDDASFDELEQSVTSIEQSLSMGEKVLYLDPVKDGKDITYLDMGELGASVDDYKDAKNLVQQGEYVYLKTDNYYNNRSDGYVDPLMPEKRGKVRDAQTAEVIEEDGVMNNVTRLTPEQEVEYAENVMNTLADSTDEQSFDKLRELGATKQQIIKRVDMGMLSVNTGEYLMNTLYGESVMPTEFGSENDFNKFLEANDKQAELYNKAITRHKVRNADDPLLAKPLAWLGNTVVDITGDDVDAAEIETLNNITKAYQRDWVARNKGKAGVTRQDLIDVYGEDDLLKEEAGVTDWQQLKETWRSAIQNAFGSTVGIAGSLGSFIGRYDEETSEVADEMLRLNTLSAKEWGKGLYQNVRTSGGDASELDMQMNKSLQEWQNHYDNKPSNLTEEQAAEWQAENQEFIDKLAATAYKRNKELFGDGAGTIEDYSLTESPELLAEAAAYASTADPDQVLRIQSILRVDPQTRGYREERDAWSQKLGMEGMNKLKAGYFGGTTAGWQELAVEAASAATGYLGAKAIVAAKNMRHFNKVSKVDPKRAWREHAMFDAQQATGKAKAMRIAGRGKYAAAIIPQTLAEGAEEGIVELGNPDITWDSFKHAVKQGMMGGAGLGLGVQMPLATYNTIKEDRSIEEHLGKLPDQVMGDERVAIMDKLRAARAEQTAQAVGETYNLKDAKADAEGNMLDPENLDVKWVELSGRHEEAVEAYEKALEASKANPGDAALKEEMEAAYIYARITKDLFEDATTQMIAEGKLEVEDTEQKASESQTPVSDSVPQADSPAADAQNPLGKKLETDEAKQDSAGGFEKLDVDNLSESSATKLDNEQDENDWHEARDKYGIEFEKKEQTRDAFRAAYQSITNDLQSNDPAVAQQARNEARVIAQKQAKRADFYEAQGDKEIASFVRKEADSFASLAGLEAPAAKEEQQQKEDQQQKPEATSKATEKPQAASKPSVGSVAQWKKENSNWNKLDTRKRIRKENAGQFDGVQRGDVVYSADYNSDGGGALTVNKVYANEQGERVADVSTKGGRVMKGISVDVFDVLLKDSSQKTSKPKKQYQLGRQPQPKRNVRDARGPELIRSSQGKALASEGAAKRALTMASKQDTKVKVDNYDVVQITEGVDKGKWEVRRKPDENTGDVASAEMGMPTTKKTESTPKTEYTKLSATPEQAFVHYTTPTLSVDKSGEGKGMTQFDEKSLDKDIAAGRTIRTDTLSERKRLGGAQVEIANNLINGGYNEVSDGVWEKRAVQKPAIKGQIDELNESHSGLKDIQKMGKRLLESKASPNEEKTAMLIMMRAAAPGAEFSFTDDSPTAGATKIDAQHKVGGTILGITPYRNKDGTQADKYTLKIDANWRQRLANDVGAKDYESATPEQKQLIEQYFAKAIDEETAHVVVLQNTTPEQRTEMAGDLLNDKQAVSDLKSYFGTKEKLQRREDESEADHSNRLVAEWTNVVRQRALYGYSNSDFVNWVNKHSKKVVEFTRNLIGSLVKSLRSQQERNYTPKVQSHLEKMEAIFSEMMGDKPTQQAQEQSTAAAPKVAPAAQVAPKVEFKYGVKAVQQYENAGKGVSVLRKDGKEHYGNPFTHLTSSTRASVQVGSLKEAVDSYVAWLNGTDHQGVEQERRQWILDQIDAGALDGATLLYYANKNKYNHADALAAFVAERRGASSAASTKTSKASPKAAPKAAISKPPSYNPNSIRDLESFNETLRETQSVHLDTIDGVVGVTGEGDLVLRVPSAPTPVGDNSERDIADIDGVDRMDWDKLRTAVDDINSSKVYKRALNTLAAYAKSDTRLSDVDSVYSLYSVASADLKTQMDTLTKMQEQLEEQKAGLTELQEEDANKDIEEQRISVERAYSEFLYAKWSMPRDFRQAYSNVLTISKLVKSAPSFDYLGDRGIGLDSSLEAEMERAALRNRATDAVTPVMRYLQIYGLETRQVGSSSRNHAPSKAIIYFNDGNPTLENLGYLMNPRQNAKIYITITPRMVADMIGLKKRIEEYLSSADTDLSEDPSSSVAAKHRADKMHAVLLNRIDALLGSPAVRAMDASEVQRYYDKDVRGKNSFGRSIFFLGKNDKVITRNSVWSDTVVRNHEGKIEYSLHPDHLRHEKDKDKKGEFLYNEIDAAAGRKRAADVRYTIGSGFAARARIAANRVVVNESTAKAMKAGDIWAPLTIAGDGTNAANPTKAHKDEVYRRTLTSIQSLPETNTKVTPLIPFPSIFGTNDMEVNWAKNIKAMFKRIVDQKLSPTQASLHPMSAYAGEILQLAQRHINKPSKYTRDNLVQRVRNISDLLGEVRKQMGNQEKSLKDVWVDTRMISEITNQIELGNVTNITPYELERMLDERTSVDASTAVLFESGTSQEKFTNTDSVLEQEEFNESARIHGLNHNSTDEEAQAKRGLMLAVLFYPDMQKAMDWASQFQSVKALDIGLFKRLDEATEEYLRFEDNYQRKQLSALMDGNAMARFAEDDILEALGATDKAAAIKRIDEALNSNQKQLRSGGWSRASITELIAAEQSNDPIMGLTGKGSYGHTLMAKLQDYIKRYDLDMRYINSYLNTGRTLYSRGEKMSTRGHLSKQTNGNLNVVSNIMGVMRGIRRAKRDVEALKAEMVDLRQVKGALGEQTADTTAEQGDRLSTIRDFVLSQPQGKVGVSSFGEYFGQPHLVKGAELTPKEYISGVLAERYAEAPVIAYNSTPALRADLGYQSTMIVQDMDGNILSILMDLKNDQFDSASEQVVAALTKHALDTGITAETSNLLNDLKANLDRYFLGDFINAQVDAEVRMLAEMTENFSPTDDVFAGYKERSAQYQRESLDKLAPQMSKLMGWAQSSTDTATHFTEMSDTDFIMQVLFNPQMRHFAGNIAAGNTLFNSLAPLMSDASLAEAQGFLEAIKMDRFSSGQASVAGDQIENLGDTEQAPEDVEADNLGAGNTRTTDEFDLPPSSPYITTYYSELDNTTSPFPAVVAMALEAIRGGEQAVNRESIKYSGLRSPNKRIDANTMSVADFYDYSFVGKQKDQRYKAAMQQIWGNLVDKRGVAYNGELTLNTTEFKWQAIQRGSRVSPRIGKASATELQIYEDAYKAALETYDGVVKNHSALISAHKDTQDAIDTYEAYPDTKDGMYYDLLGSMEVIEHRLSYVEGQLAGLTRDRFAVKTAQKAGVKAYEQRMMEKRALQKRASQVLKEEPPAFTPSLLYKSPYEMNVRLNDGVNSILEQADRVANEEAQSLFETQDPGSYPDVEIAPKQEERLIAQNELGAKPSKASAENKKVPALKGGEAVPVHKAVGSASGVSRSEQDKQAGEEYTDRIKKRLYNSSPLYKAMMDNEANSPTAISLNGMIATVADVATNKKWKKETRGSANFLLSRLIAGETSFFYKEANKLRSHSGSLSNIDSVINGINPNTKSNWFTHQDAQITDLFYKDKQAYRHGLMMMAEQDFGVYTNTGRNNWKSNINELTERWTRTASKVGSELATKAYVGRLIANVASNSKASDIAQIERNLDAIEAGAKLNKQAAGKLDRELLQQSDYALEMVGVARKWIAKHVDEVDAASLDAYLLASLGNGAKAKMARSLIEDATQFFDSHKWGMSMMAEMQGKKIGMYDRYLPMRGYDIGGNPMDGMDGVEQPYADMSHSQERSRYEWDDQTRGLDFNPLRALLAGANATLYHTNTFDSLQKAKHDFGSDGVDSQYTRNALASDLTAEQKAAVQVMNNVMRKEVERQRYNDVSHSQHSGKILSTFSSLSTMGYRASLTSLSQMYLQTLPGAISYITSNPAKGVRLVDNMMRMLGSAPQGLYNNLQDNNHSAYMNDVGALIKRVSPELYARSLDGITELKDNLAKLNMAEVKGAGDLLTTGVGSTYKGVNKIYDMLLHLSTGAPDSFLVRAMFATEYEMETGKRIDSTTAANFDKQAAVMARVESEARMAQSDASKKATIFQPVAKGGSVGYSLEVARKSTLVFGNHMLSLAPRVKTGLKMMAPGSDNKAYGARIVSDFIMQAALFNGMKIRNLAFIATYLLMPPPDEDELNKLKKKQELAKKGGEKLTKEEKKRLVMLGREVDHYAEQFDVKQKAILDSYHSIPFTGDYSRPYTKDDVMYSFALKTGIDLLGGAHAALAIPMLNGRVLDQAKELTYRTTGVKYAGMQERHMDFYTDKIEYAGAAGIALNKMVNLGSTYAHAKRDYELSWADVQYGASIFGGSREVSSALEKEIRKRNDTFVFKQDRRTKRELQAPDLFSSRPHSFRGHERMPRPEGVEDYSLRHHPDAAVTLDMFDGMKLHSVDLMNRPWGDGDSVPLSKGLLNSQTYRFVGIDTLETTYNTKEMRNRVYRQSLATGIKPRDITPAGKQQSYITQHAFDSADKVMIATLGEAAFERDVKSTERHDAVLLIQKDGVWYDHGLSMAYNGDAAVSKYGLSRLPKKLKGQMYDRYENAKLVADQERSGSMYPTRKKPKKKQAKATNSVRTKTRNIDLLRRIRG